MLYFASILLTGFLAWYVWRQRNAPGSRAYAGLALVILAVIGALWLGLDLSSARRDTWARIRRDGVVRIGYAIEAPYIFLDASGRLTGLEYETNQAIAARLAIPRTEWVQTEFGSLISELEEGRFDVIAAGMFITPERAQRVNFSEPTFHVRQALLVQVGNPYRLHSYADVQHNPQVKVAVLRGAIEEQILRQMGASETQIISVPDALTGRVAVESGIADCLALSWPTIQLMAQQQSLGHTEIAQPFVQPSVPGEHLVGFGAVALRKTDETLRDAWNQQLLQFIGSPEHLLLLARFGFSAEDLPGSVTTDMILSREIP